MATTLSILNLLTLPHKPFQILSKLPISPNQPSPLSPKTQTTHKNSPKRPSTNYNHLPFPLQHSHCLSSSTIGFAMIHLYLEVIKQDVLAVGGEFGLLEGRTFALVHPILIAGLFFYTMWAGYLGWQWRRVQTTQNEINELKKQVNPAPVAPEGVHQRKQRHQCRPLRPTSRNSLRYCNRTM